MRDIGDGPGRTSGFSYSCSVDEPCFTMGSVDPPLILRVQDDVEMYNDYCTGQ